MYGVIVNGTPNVATISFVLSEYVCALALRTPRHVNTNNKIFFMIVRI